MNTAPSPAEMSCQPLNELFFSHKEQNSVLCRQCNGTGEEVEQTGDHPGIWNKPDSEKDVTGLLLGPSDMAKYIKKYDKEIQDQPWCLLLENGEENQNWSPSQGQFLFSGKRRHGRV